MLSTASPPPPQTAWPAPHSLEATPQTGPPAHWSTVPLPGPAAYPPQEEASSAGPS